MEESVLYLWYLSETRDTALGHKTRFPARSTPFRELSAGMNLAVLFENDYVRENLGELKVEAVGVGSVTISYRGETFTLRRGEHFSSAMHRAGSSYMPEYVGIEAELS